jgi:hypothetical protein
MHVTMARLKDEFCLVLSSRTFNLEIEALADISHSASTTTVSTRHHLPTSQPTMRMTTSARPCSRRSAPLRCCPAGTSGSSGESMAQCGGGNGILIVISANGRGNLVMTPQVHRWSRGLHFLTPGRAKCSKSGNFAKSREIAVFGAPFGRDSSKNSSQSQSRIPAKRTLNDLLPPPRKSVVVGFRVTSLTEFLENTCNICICK